MVVELLEMVVLEEVDEETVCRKDSPAVDGPLEVVAVVVVVVVVVEVVIEVEKVTIRARP